MKRSEKYWLAGAFVAATLGTSLIVASEIRDARYLHQALTELESTLNAHVDKQPQKIVYKTPADNTQVKMIVPVADYSEYAEIPKKKKSLSDYPGFSKDPEVDELRFDQEDKQREEFVASCMNTKGYNYQPAPSVVVDMNLDTNIDELVASLQDPNEAYVASLSMPEREYYYTALVGVADPNAREADNLPDFTDGGGCVGEALRQIPGIYAVKNSLRNEYDDMTTAIDEDPRTEEARTVWVRCMQGKGYNFESPAAVFDEIEGYYLEQTVANQAVNDEYYQAVIATSEACEEIIAPTTNEIRNDYERKFVEENSASLSN